MRITEIYASVHGESQYAGLPCTLVRTTGCDLRCSYCDTTYAFTGGKEMTIEEIVMEVDRLGLPFVLLTGGEPMLQREIVPLATRLLGHPYRVAMETSGAHALDALPTEVLRIVDVKTPSSGEAERMRWEILASLRGCDAAKFVLSDEADYRWSTDHVRRLGLASHTMRCDVAQESFVGAHRAQAQEGLGATHAPAVDAIERRAEKVRGQGMKGGL